ncbi:hypothetical protein BGZ96_004526 [Linnemannia gamsii]|uniref:Uncharacterized protein n=1 Tax=Linnemannia gamsii TaxID=64522 RepID=A0ABQ7K738_9FUNG|nr:hypothetical protein BGZ96_004526 [Linnemannia gamsii]
MTVNSRWGRISDAASVSLILFGFLSTMCPALQELSLRSSVLNLSFQGELCLLTRLRGLERLRIVLHRIMKYDTDALSWILPPPKLTAWRCLAYPLRQHKISNIRKEIWRRYNDNMLDRPPFSVAGFGSKFVERGREVGVAVSAIGHPDEMLKWMDDYYGVTADFPATTSGIDVNTVAPRNNLSLNPPWPRLQSFCLEHRTDNKIFTQKLEETEVFLTNARPNVDFQLCQAHRDDFDMTTLRLY